MYDTCMSINEWIDCYYTIHYTYRFIFCIATIVAFWDHMSYEASQVSGCGKNPIHLQMIDQEMQGQYNIVI